MQAWENFLKELEKEMGQHAIERWLRPLKVVDYDAGNLYLEAENAFQVLWFEEHIRPLTLTHLRKQDNQPIKIHLRAPDLPQKTKPLPQKASPVFEIRPDSLDPSCSLDEFIVSESNQMLLRFLSDLPLGNYNPLLLHGPAGVGKTHLLMALAHLYKAKGKRIFYVHAETFTQHVVNAIRSSQMGPVREIYRAVDILLIDDVHHLARKNATQEEFFHTFNALHSSGKQIILSSKCAPSQLEDIEPRLISRFEWGIVFQVHPLEWEDQREMLKNRAQWLKLPLSDETLTFLLKTFRSSPKALMRALEALVLRSSKRHYTQSPEEISDKLADLIREEQKNALTPEKIVQATANYFGIQPADILGKSQARSFSLPRQIALYLCREKLKISFLALGRIFDRDHSTIMSSIRLIEKKKALEGEIASALQELNKTFSH